MGVQTHRQKYGTVLEYFFRHIPLGREITGEDEGVDCAIVCHTLVLHDVIPSREMHSLYEGITMNVAIE